MESETPETRERNRLQALKRYEIIDTPFEPAFDRIAHLAATFLTAPIALVSFVDHHRQWFKACYGLDIRESARELSFCAHTLHNGKTLVVPDARLDERFATNPFVTGDPHIRFYAGAPLVTEDGYTLGTLCVIDPQPRRDLTPDQKVTLENLASLVVDELELRRTATALKQSERSLESRVEARTAELEKAKEALEQVNLQLQYHAFHDKLTGLANRALLMDHLHQATERSYRDGGNYALVFIDLDHFKVVNDSLGHTLGDLLLIAFGKRLQRCVRPTDTVARLGGDEFIILLEDVSAQAVAVQTAERVSQALAEPFSIKGHTLHVSASMGIVTNETGVSRVDDLIRDADIAMYNAKAKGRARYQLFTGAMRERASHRLSLENDLRRALVQGEMRAFYQPIVTLDTRKLVGVEALLRWQHPEHGLVLPERFIPVAEESGLMVELDYWMLSTACHQVKGWHAQYPSLTLNVNLSGQTFTSDDLLETVGETLETTGFPPILLQLELTETALMQHTSGAEHPLSALRARGVQLSIDDFGTGYSSLKYLQQFPFQSLKIDTSFVRDMTSNAKSEALVKAIIALAHSLDLDVVAEGIETPTQLESLQGFQCESGQGFLLAQPLSSDKMEAFIGQAGLAAT